VAASAAQNVVGTIAGGENLALRDFGGPCQGSNTKLLVPFAQNSAKRVQTRLASLTAAGDATLNRAINEAIGDFGDQKRFEGANRRILVVTGSDDTCAAAELTEAIREKLAADANGAYKIRLDFRFIGIGLRPEQQQNLTGLATVTGGRAVFANHPAAVEPLLRSEVHPAETQKQQQPALGVAEKTGQPKDADIHVAHASAEHPIAPTEGDKVAVRRDVKHLVDTLAAGVNHLNTALDNIKKGDLLGARLATVSAQAATGDSGILLESAWLRERFPELDQVSRKCFELYHKLAARVSEMISLYEKKDFESYEKSAAEFEHLTAQFNPTKKKLLDLLAHQ